MRRWPLARRRPVGGLAGRLRQRPGYDRSHHVSGQWGNARWAGLVAQEAVHAGMHEAFLPAPDNGLALAGLLHDRRRPEAVGGQQYDPAVVLLLRVAT